MRKNNTPFSVDGTDVTMFYDNGTVQTVTLHGTYTAKTLIEYLVDEYPLAVEFEFLDSTGKVLRVVKRLD